MDQLPLRFLPILPLLQLEWTDPTICYVSFSFSPLFHNKILINLLENVIVVIENYDSDFV